MKSDTLEERYAIKFCFKLGNNATETYEMLQTAFQPSCMNRASVFEWYKRFKEGRESVRDDERCGKSKEVNTPELIGQRVSFVVVDYVVIEMKLANLIISKYSKLAQRKYKTRHDWVDKVIHWELCKKLKFNHTNTWYMHNPVSV